MAALKRGGQAAGPPVEIGEGPSRPIALLFALPDIRGAVAALGGAPSQELHEHWDNIPIVPAVLSPWPGEEGAESVVRLRSVQVRDDELTDGSQQRVCQFIVDRLGFDGDPAELCGDPPRLLPEVLDSEEVLELVSWIEVEYDIEIEDDEINRDNFLTVADLARFIDAKRAG